MIRAFAQDDGAQHSGVDHRRLCERVPDRHPPVDDLAVGVQRGTTGLDSCSEDQGVVQLVTTTGRNRRADSCAVRVIGCGVAQSARIALSARSASGQARCKRNPFGKAQPSLLGVSSALSRRVSRHTEPASVCHFDLVALTQPQRVDDRRRQSYSQAVPPPADHSSRYTW